MCVEFGLDPMSNFGFFWIFNFPRLIQLINKYSKLYRFVVEGWIKKLSTTSLHVRLKMPCAKFGVDWSRNVGEVGKKQFCGFRDFAKKNYGRKWAWLMPKDGAYSSEYVRTSF